MDFWTLLYRFGARASPHSLITNAITTLYSLASHLSCVRASREYGGGSVGERPKCGAPLRVCMESSTSTSTGEPMASYRGTASLTNVPSPDSDGVSVSGFDCEWLMSPSILSWWWWEAKAVDGVLAAEEEGGTAVYERLNGFGSICGWVEATGFLIGHPEDLCIEGTSRGQLQRVASIYLRPRIEI